MHVQTKTIIPPSLYYELLYYENESPYKFVILIYQLINLPLKLYEEFVARYSQILFDPEEKSFQPIGSRFENGRHVVARKEGRKAEGKRKNNGGEREKEKEREGKRADGRHGSGELQ